MKVTLIGAGNVGWHLGRKLHECGVEVVQVFSRQESKASALAKLTGADFTDRLEAISAQADLYLLAVSDDAIAGVARRLAAGAPGGKLMAHTSGATPMQVFAEAGAAARYGVFYPLQTFSKKRAPDFSQIPFCIDANNDADRELLFSLARQLSPKVYHLNDEQRAVLHVAAVFVNNFANFLFHAGYELLAREGLPFGLLLPLIRETAAKLEDAPPRDMQTGPARRNDRETIQRHLQLLENHPAYHRLYEILTENIHQIYHSAT